MFRGLMAALELRPANQAASFFGNQPQTQRHVGLCGAYGVLIGRTVRFSCRSFHRPSIEFPVYLHPLVSLLLLGQDLLCAARGLQATKVNAVGSQSSFKQRNL